MSKISKSTSGKSKFSSSKKNVIYRDPLFYIKGNPKTLLGVDGISYPINFKTCILSNIGNASTDKKGLKGKSHRITKSVNLFDLGSRDKDSINQYREKQLLNLKGEHRVVDFYFDNKINNVNLQELLYQNGDTLLLKAKIQDGKLVPLF